MMSQKVQATLYCFVWKVIRICQLHESMRHQHPPRPPPPPQHHHHHHHRHHHHHHHHHHGRRCCWCRRRRLFAIIVIVVLAFVLLRIMITITLNSLSCFALKTGGSGAASLRLLSWPTPGKENAGLHSSW